MRDGSVKHVIVNLQIDYGMPLESGLADLVVDPHFTSVNFPAIQSGKVFRRFVLLSSPTIWFKIDALATLKKLGLEHPDAQSLKALALCEDIGLKRLLEHDCSGVVCVNTNPWKDPEGQIWNPKVWFDGKRKISLVRTNEVRNSSFLFFGIE